MISRNALTALCVEAQVTTDVAVLRRIIDRLALHLEPKPADEPKNTPAPSSPPTAMSTDAERREIIGVVRRAQVHTLSQDAAVAVIEYIERAMPIRATKETQTLREAAQTILDTVDDPYWGRFPLVGHPTVDALRAALSIADAGEVMLAAASAPDQSSEDEKEGHS